MMVAVWLFLLLAQTSTTLTTGSSFSYSELASAAQTQPMSAASAFSERDASHLLEQISQGLISRNQNQVLGAFDLSGMRDRALFRQQIVSFVAHAENIRLYFHVTRVSASTEKSDAEAEVEMEADARDSNNAAPIHKEARLHLSARNTSSGWRFTDVQPRGFFSLQP
jgi:hypothetical protein